jgi:ribonuclease BN (tRNA processing enzyme)
MLMVGNRVTHLRFSRRSMIAGVAASPALDALAGPAAAQPAAAAKALAELANAKGTKLVLLGTGAGPVPGRTRRMTSHVMVSNDVAYVLDCGLGTTDRFAQAGLAFQKLRSIFITHHHPDHNIEFGPFLVIGWLQGMPLSVRAFGPPPLKQMTADFMAFAKTTIEFWAEDFHMPPLDMIEVGEVAAAGLVTEDENVKVTAEVVQHPPVKPAFAYRFDFRDRSIAFSGDTVPLAAVVRLAKGADVLVHEAMYVPAMEAFARAAIAKGAPISFDAFIAHMRADHSPVEEVGRIAQDAGVKTLVLSHLAPSIDTITDETWATAAAKYFNGDIIVGHDLMVV